MAAIPRRLRRSNQLGSCFTRGQSGAAGQQVPQLDSGGDKATLEPERRPARLQRDGSFQHPARSRSPSKPWVRSEVRGQRSERLKSRGVPALLRLKVA